MAGDPFRRMQAGDPLNIPAVAYNSFLDTTEKFRAQQRQQRKGDTPPPPWPLTLALVENDTDDADLDQFAILGIDSPIIDPSDDPDTFAERVAISGVAPTSDHVGNGKFVILLEPCAAGEVALCAIAGATACLINVGDESDEFADAQSGSTDALTSCTRGPIRILWKESGTGSGKWAYVRWIDRAEMFPVLVRKDGGDAGSLSMTEDCTFTYTLYRLDGSAIIGATGLTPDRARYPSCKYTAAADDTLGIAYYDNSGDIALADALDERATTTTIDVPTTFVVDTATQKLQWKLTSALVLDKGDEGDATDIHTGDVCS